LAGDISADPSIAVSERLNLGGSSEKLIPNRRENFTSKGQVIISSKAAWKEFLTRYYKNDLQVLAMSSKKYKSITVDFKDLQNYSTSIASDLINNPDSVLEDAKDAIPLVDLPVKKKLVAAVRISDLPKKSLVRELRSDDADTFISIDGLIKNASTVKDRLIVGAFQCARCGNIVNLPQPADGRLLMPAACKCKDDAKGIFRLLEGKNEGSEKVDFQHARLMESQEAVKGGERPQSIDINFINDLAGLVWPGMHVTITGVLRNLRHMENNHPTIDYDRYIDVNNIEYEKGDYGDIQITLEDEDQIEKICKKGNVLSQFIRSIAPTIYGYEDVKAAVALQLFSGIEIMMPDGVHLRGDIHVLLVGDPGIAKSQILRYIVNLAPRGKYTNGKTSSGVGLTASVTKSDFGGEHWEVEAGPLVMADKGLCAIDELEKMKPEHRADLLEAMEQQCVHIAKAGQEIMLMCRTCILGAANPKKGRFEPYDDLPEQVNMEPYFMSRFDAVFLMRDVPDPKRDRKIAEHIISVRNAGEMIMRRKNMVKHGVNENVLKERLDGKTPEIDSELLRKYVAYAKRHVYPIMTDAARAKIIEYYLEMRKPGDHDKGPISITARQLEGLVRFAEASARMRLSDEVTEDDAKIAVEVIQGSLQQTCMDPDTGEIDADILTVGISKSQREKIADYKTMIIELSAKHGGYAPEEELFEKAKENGYERSKAEKQLKKMREIGEITWRDGKIWPN
jgi:replicative DNA helicase Mcm